MWLRRLHARQSDSGAVTVSISRAARRPRPARRDVHHAGYDARGGRHCRLVPRPFDLSRSPVVEFQFTYPADLTLGIGAGQTNFLALLRESTVCLETRIPFAEA